jgi:hypothetical protein
MVRKGSSVRVRCWACATKRHVCWQFDVRQAPSAGQPHRLRVRVGYNPVARNLDRGLGVDPSSAPAASLRRHAARARANPSRRLKSPAVFVTVRTSETATSHLRLCDWDAGQPRNARPERSSRVYRRGSGTRPRQCTNWLMSRTRCSVRCCKGARPRWVAWAALSTCCRPNDPRTASRRLGWGTVRPRHTTLPTGTTRHSRGFLRRRAQSASYARSNQCHSIAH